MVLPQNNLPKICWHARCTGMRKSLNYEAKDTMLYVVGRMYPLSQESMIIDGVSFTFEFDICRRGASMWMWEALECSLLLKWRQGFVIWASCLQAVYPSFGVLRGCCLLCLTIQKGYLTLGRRGTLNVATSIVRVGFNMNSEGAEIGV